MKKTKKINYKSIKCPLCGSNADIKSDPVEFRMIGGGRLESPQFYIECKSCGEAVVAEAQTEEALKESKQKYIKEQLVTVLSNISSSFPSISFVERSLGLPMRSFNRWKSDGTSSSSFLLAKYIEAMPFLVEVARNDFDENVRDNLILEESKKAFKRLAVRSAMSSAVISESSLNGYSVMFTASSPLDYGGAVAVSNDVEREMSVEFISSNQLRYGT